MACTVIVDKSKTVELDFLIALIDSYFIQLILISISSRVSLPIHFVRMALGRLRSDDLYNATRCYPNPEHRATALAEQVSILFEKTFNYPVLDNILVI
jgi:hypothetical protein